MGHGRPLPGAGELLTAGRLPPMKRGQYAAVIQEHTVGKMEVCREARTYTLTQRLASDAPGWKGF